VTVNLKARKKTMKRKFTHKNVRLKTLKGWQGSSLKLIKFLTSHNLSIQTEVHLKPGLKLQTYLMKTR